MRILSDARNPSLNPYGKLLALAVEEADKGMSILPFKPRALLHPHRPDLWHLHWPESVGATGNWARAALDLTSFSVAMAAARAREVRMVWTVHNLRAHEDRRSNSRTRSFRRFVSQLDGWISLSKTGASMALAEYPELNALPALVVPHGHYVDAYPPAVPREAARSILGVHDSARVVLFLGAIRPYKNVEGLITAFRATGQGELRLIVAGEPLDRSIGIEVENSWGGDERIRLCLGVVAPERVPVLMGATDGVVFPATEFFNSGSILLALSFGVPVLAPDTPVMRELQNSLGGDAVHLFNGELSGQNLEAFAHSPRAEAADLIHRVRKAHDWSRIGAATADFYRMVVDGSPSTRPQGRGFMENTP